MLTFPHLVPSPSFLYSLWCCGVFTFVQNSDIQIALGCALLREIGVGCALGGACSDRLGAVLARSRIDRTLYVLFSLGRLLGVWTLRVGDCPRASNLMKQSFIRPSL